MIQGLEAILASMKCGIPQKHLEALLLAANETRLIISIRPVSIFARYFLEKGFPTKPFPVKNKSSKAGPMAGLISIDPLYGRNPQDKIAGEKHKKQLQSAQKDPDLVPVDLVLSSERIQELCTELKAMTSTVNADKTLNLTWTVNGLTQTAIAKPLDDGRYQIVDTQGKAIQVLGRTLAKDAPAEYITADFDLNDIKEPYQTFSVKLNTPPHRVLGSIEKAQEEASSSASREIDKRGNITRLNLERVGIINQYLAHFDAQRREGSPLPARTERDWVARYLKDYDYAVTAKTVEKLPDPEQLAKEDVPTIFKCQSSADQPCRYFIYDHKPAEKESQALDDEPMLLKELSALDVEACKKLKFPAISAAAERHFVTQDDALFKTLDAEGLIAKTLISERPTVETAIIKGRELVHHNQEMHNPFAELLKDNLPLLFVTPTHLKGYSSPLILAETISEVIQLNRQMRETYYSPSHASYKEFSRFNAPTAEIETLLKALTAIQEGVEKGIPGYRISDYVEVAQDLKHYYAEQKLLGNLPDDFIEKYNATILKIPQDNLLYVEEATEKLTRMQAGMFKGEPGQYFSHYTGLATALKELLQQENQKSLPERFVSEHQKTLAQLDLQMQQVETERLIRGALHEDVGHQFALLQENQTLEDGHVYFKEEKGQIFYSLLSPEGQAIQNQPLELTRNDPTKPLSVDELYQKRGEITQALLSQGQVPNPRVEDEEGDKINAYTHLEALLEELAMLTKNTTQLPTKETAAEYTSLCAQLAEIVTHFEYCQKYSPKEKPYVNPESMDYLKAQLKNHQRMSTTLQAQIREAKQEPVREAKTETTRLDPPKTSFYGKRSSFLLFRSPPQTAPTPAPLPEPALNSLRKK